MNARLVSAVTFGALVSVVLGDIGSFGPTPYCCRPPKIPHGTVGNADPTSTSDQVRNFTCKLGYQVVGSNQITCTSCGKWQVDGTCQQYQPQCGLPPAVANAIVADGTSSVGDSRDVTCKTDYKICGQPSITCTLSGWSTAPFCVSSALSCPAASG